MTWLTVTISAYLIMAVVSLTDKYLLVGSIKNPKVYAFYVGILGGLIILLAPFTGFYIPESGQIILGIISGAFFVFSLLWFYKGLKIFEASRIIPAVGGLTPLFTFGLIYLLSRGEESLLFSEIVAFLFLVAGSVLIGAERGRLINASSLKISFIAALFGAISLTATKYLFLTVPFWTGFIWKGIGGVLAAFFIFIIFSDIRKDIFKKEERITKKTTVVFLLNQAAGAVASILFNWAISLVPLAYVAFINAVQGTQYVFLLIFSIILSLKFPAILKERMSKNIFIQKISAILLIGAGLYILAI
jgi:drug/metabolite transporter (DMT)-like permease